MVIAAQDLRIIGGVQHDLAERRIRRQRTDRQPAGAVLLQRGVVRHRQLPSGLLKANGKFQAMAGGRHDFVGQQHA